MRVLRGYLTPVLMVGVFGAMTLGMEFGGDELLTEATPEWVVWVLQGCGGVLLAGLALGIFWFGVHELWDTWGDWWRDLWGGGR